jgi:hypothetical protein
LTCQHIPLVYTRSRLCPIIMMKSVRLCG